MVVYYYMYAYKRRDLLLEYLFLSMLFIPSPEGLSSNAWLVASIVVLMAIWWATEAIPVPVTALLPLALFPLLEFIIQRGCITLRKSNIYLFLGGFILALAIEVRSS